VHVLQAQRTACRGGGRQGGRVEADAVQKQVFLNTKPRREAGNTMVGAADTAATLAQAPFRVKRMPRVGHCVNRMNLRRLHRGKILTAKVWC
jgi:hypothetical protein